MFAIHHRKLHPCMNVNIHSIKAKANVSVCMQLGFSFQKIIKYIRLWKSSDILSTSLNELAVVRIVVCINQNIKHEIIPKNALYLFFARASFKLVTQNSRALNVACYYQHTWERFQNVSTSLRLSYQLCYKNFERSIQCTTEIISIHMNRNVRYR